MVEKRANDPDETGSDAKKPRVDAGASAPAATRPGLSLAALEKAKKALQLQKQLKEKMKNLPQLQKAAGAAASTPVSVLEAAKKAAEIASKITNAPVVAPPILQQQPAALTSSVVTALSGIPAAASSFKAPVLRLDSQGREVDEHGKPIQRQVQVVSTLKVNQQHVKGAPAPAPAKTSFLDLYAPPENEESEFHDPRMSAGGKKMDRRKRSGFEFVQEGQFQKQAEMLRLKAQYGEGAMRRGPVLPKGPIGPGLKPNDVPIGGGPPGSMDPNLVPVKPRTFTAASDEEEKSDEETASTDSEELDALVDVIEPPQPVPDVEWWDRHLLATGSYEEDIGLGEDGEPKDGLVSIKETKITIYIEHPVPIEPPAEAPPPPPQPLKLTKKELKKLRTQRRNAREKEKQELIRQGLLEPPKPKIKIANLYRVLGEQAVADPTAMEQETRKQMAERQNAHDDRNLARQLTPAEKRDKKMKKLFDDNQVDLQSAVYKVTRLNGQQKFKVDINAKENHLKGALIMSPDFCLVAVEGCNKSIKRYNKLMLRRIDWSAELENHKISSAMDEDGDEEEKEEPSPNTCSLVWHGLLKESTFKDFRVYTDSSVEAACAVLEKHRVRHYWDLVKNFNPDEAPEFEL
eukprot:gene6696-3366_t